jgi:hypothetical protein
MRRGGSTLRYAFPTDNNTVYGACDIKYRANRLHTKELSIEKPVMHALTLDTTNGTTGKNDLEFGFTRLSDMDSRRFLFIDL